MQDTELTILQKQERYEFHVMLTCHCLIGDPSYYSLPCVNVKKTYQNSIHTTSTDLEKFNLINFT